MIAFFCLFFRALSLSFKEFQPAHHPHPNAVIAKNPVFILHGLFGSKTNWQSIAKTLSNRLGQRVFTLDSRNHGDSPHDPDHSYQAMSEDVAKLMEDLDISKTSLIGHSMVSE